VLFWYHGNMVKKTNIQRQTANGKRERIALWLVIIILIALQAISGWYLVKIWNIESQDSKHDFAELINKSEEQRYNSPVIDVSENRVYIPEARVYFPLNEVTRDLRYDFVDTQGPTLLYLSTASFVGAQKEEDDHSCDKVVSFQQAVEPALSELSLIGEIAPTKDGLRYAFAHNKENCSIYYGTVRDDLINAAKAIQNY